MVHLHIKRDNESQFFYNVSVNTPVDVCRRAVISIYNGRLKISRICSEMEHLKNYGIMCPSSATPMLNDENEDVITEDEYADNYVPVGGWACNKDPTGRRNGRQPKQDMQDVILKALDEAKTVISKKLISYLTEDKIRETLEMLKDTILIVYPMNIPQHDVIRQELECCENLGKSLNQEAAMDPDSALLWFSGTVLQSDKMLYDYVGRNEKTKVVLKVTDANSGPPQQPRLSEEDQRLMLLHTYKKAEELKKTDILHKPVTRSSRLQTQNVNQSVMETRSKTGSIAKKAKRNGRT